MAFDCCSLCSMFSCDCTENDECKKYYKTYKPKNPKTIAGYGIWRVFTDEELKIDQDFFGGIKLNLSSFVTNCLTYGGTMTIAELVEKAYANAKEKGWHETERSPLEYHALIHSEVSEATEEARKKNYPPIYQSKIDDHGLTQNSFDYTGWDLTLKPEGELIELADVIIRIADYCGSRGWDLEKAIEIKMDYNKTRPHRHGGKVY